MKIKRYAAASMRAALALVRAEQGPDAVILSSRRSEDGIEVIAAVDYDEALFVDAKRQSAAPSIAPPSRDASPASVTIAPAAPAAPRAPATDLGYGAMQRELVGLRRMLETGLGGMTWNDMRLR